MVTSSADEIGNLWKFFPEELRSLLADRPVKLNDSYRLPNEKYVEGRLGLLIIPLLLYQWYEKDFSQTDQINTTLEVFDLLLDLGGAFEKGERSITEVEDTYFRIVSCYQINQKWATDLWNSFSCSSSTSKVA